METSRSTPLTVCMQNGRGEEIALNVEPGDDFATFLRRAEELLGFEIDVGCITQNKVSLTENIYDFLINADETQLNPSVIQEEIIDSGQPLLTVQNNPQDDTLYVLDDGTQFKASQLRVNTDDSAVMLDINKIPFIKYANVDIPVDIVNSTDVTKVISITKSPPSRREKYTFIDSLPFRSVHGHRSHFHSHRYREIHRMMPNDIQYDDISCLTRGQVLNLLKDSPVMNAIEFINEEQERPKHVRKTDPSKLNTKKLPVETISDVMTVTHSENCNRCNICNVIIVNQFDQIYLFDREDQKAYRSSPKRELATPLKIICSGCLDMYFKFCLELLNEKTLGENDYLIIRHNQQYLYKKMLPLPPRPVEIANVKTVHVLTDKDKRDAELVQECILEKGETANENVHSEVDKVKKEDQTELVEEDEDTKSIDILVESEKKCEVKEKIKEEKIFESPQRESYSDVEFLDDLEKETGNDMKCRFCHKQFLHLDQAVEHGTEHRLLEENVFPCPLCEYGYQTFPWLRGHMYSKHSAVDPESKEKPPATPTPSSISNESDTEYLTNPQSPIATHTRSHKRTISSKRKGKCKEKKMKKQKKSKDSDPEKPNSNTLSCTDKEETNGTSQDEDDSLWIVESIPKNPKPRAPKQNSENKTKTYPCPFCNKRFISEETLASHEARKCKGPKIIVNKKSNIDILDTLIMPNEQKFFEKAQKVKERKSEQWLDESSGNIYPGTRRTGVSSDPTVMTCDDCGSTFTSKVRLKFHIQFHGPTSMLDSTGRYTCPRCPAIEFATESELFDHAHFAHGKRGRWACPVVGCHKTFFLRAMLTKHGRTHTDTRRYVCSECGKRFLDKQTLDEHGVTHLKTKPFQCHICLKQLTRRSRLRMHLRAHEERLTPRVLHACRKCARAFKNLEEATDHATNSECAERIKKQHENPSQGAHSISEVQDNQNIQLSDESDYEEHIGRILEPESTPEVREMRARMSEETRRLIRIIETEKVFRCEYCEDVFYLTDSLNNHRLIHRGVKNPFTCHICKVSFPTYSRCTTHKTTHGYFKRSLTELRARTDSALPTQRETGPSAGGIVGYGNFPVVKHFLCEDCGRSYLHWTYLQVHRRMKHPTDGAVYTCPECGIVFPNSWSMSYHKRKVHGTGAKIDGHKENNANATPNIKYPCRDCNEIFTNKSALYTHRRKAHITRIHHHAPKSVGLFACGTCRRCYTSRPALEAHLRSSARICTSAAPYACARCGSSFTTCARLASHFLSSARCSQRPVHYPRFLRETGMHPEPRQFETPQHVIVLEMNGLNPTPDEVIKQLRMNDISLEKVVEINKVSFPKSTGHGDQVQGAADLVLTGSDGTQTGPEADAARAWSEQVMAVIAQRLPESAKRPPDVVHSWRRGHYAEPAPPPRTPTNPQCADTDTFHVEIKDVAVDELTQLLGGVITSDGKGMMLTSGQFVPFDTVMAESSQQNPVHSLPPRPEVNKHRYLHQALYNGHPPHQYSTNIPQNYRYGRHRKHIKSSKIRSMEKQRYLNAQSNMQYRYALPEHAQILDGSQWDWNSISQQYYNHANTSSQTTYNIDMHNGRNVSHLMYNFDVQTSQALYNLQTTDNLSTDLASAIFNQQTLGATSFDAGEIVQAKDLGKTPKLPETSVNESLTEKPAYDPQNVAEKNSSQFNKAGDMPSLFDTGDEQTPQQPFNAPENFLNPQNSSYEQTTRTYTFLENSQSTQILVNSTQTNNERCDPQNFHEYSVLDTNATLPSFQETQQFTNNPLGLHSYQFGQNDHNSEQFQFNNITTPDYHRLQFGDIPPFDSADQAHLALADNIPPFDSVIQNNLTAVDNIPQFENSLSVSDNITSFSNVEDNHLTECDNILPFNSADIINLPVNASMPTFDNDHQNNLSSNDNISPLDVVDQSHLASSNNFPKYHNLDQNKSVEGDNISRFGNAEQNMLNVDGVVSLCENSDNNLSINPSCDVSENNFVAVDNNSSKYGNDDQNNFSVAENIPQCDNNKNNEDLSDNIPKFSNVTSTNLTVSNNVAPLDNVNQNNLDATLKNSVLKNFENNDLSTSGNIPPFQIIHQPDSSISGNDDQFNNLVLGDTSVSILGALTNFTLHNINTGPYDQNYVADPSTGIFDNHNLVNDDHNVVSHLESDVQNNFSHNNQISEDNVSEKMTIINEDK